MLETWDEFISNESLEISYYGGEDVAYEDYNYRLQQASEIFETKLKEAEDPETKQKVKEEYEKECLCAEEEFENKIYGRIPF